MKDIKLLFEHLTKIWYLEIIHSRKKTEMWLLGLMSDRAIWLQLSVPALVCCNINLI